MDEQCCLPIHEIVIFLGTFDGVGCYILYYVSAFGTSTRLLSRVYPKGTPLGCRSSLITNGNIDSESGLLCQSRLREETYEAVMCPFQITTSRNFDYFDKQDVFQSIHR